MAAKESQELMEHQYAMTISQIRFSVIFIVVIGSTRAYWPKR